MIELQQEFMQAFIDKSSQVELGPGTYILESPIVDGQVEFIVVDWQCQVVLNAAGGRITLYHNNIKIANGYFTSQIFPNPIVVEYCTQQLNINISPEE